MTERVLVEICVASVEGAMAAQEAGADRIELNAGLELGGLTPSAGLLHEVRRAVSLPLVAMIRPRAAGFCYSQAEFEVMRRDIDAALEFGADGVAFGLLGSDGMPDAAQCEQLVRQIGATGGPQRAAVFHRAFDFVPDAFVALERLIDIGFTWVMTSGCAPTALEGASLIAELVARSGDRIEILPAGGIRAGNVREVLARTGCNQVHASCSETRTEAGMVGGLSLVLPGARPEGYVATNPSQVRGLVNVVRGNHRIATP